MAAASTIVQIVRYGIAGLLNTALGLGTVLTLQVATTLGPYWSNAAGYAVGLSVSFAINRTWTFGTRDRTVARAARFLLAFAVAYGANLAVLHWAIAFLGRPVVAQVVANLVYSLLFFALCKLVVFRTTSSPLPRVAGPGTRA